MSLDVHPWRKRYGCIGWALGFNTQASTQVGSESKLWVNVEHSKSQIDRNLWKWKDYIVKHNHDSDQLSLLMWFKWKILSNSHELSELCLALCTIFGPPKLCGDLTVLQCYWGWQHWIQWLHQAPKTRAWSELWIQGFLRPNSTLPVLSGPITLSQKKKKNPSTAWNGISKPRPLLDCLANGFSGMAWVARVTHLFVSCKERAEHGGLDGLSKWQMWVPPTSQSLGGQLTWQELDSKSWRNLENPKTQKDSVETSRWFRAANISQLVLFCHYFQHFEV